MNDSIYIDSVFLDFNGVHILRGVHLEFEKNKVTGLLGRNGCGKSCLLRIVTGQLQPQSKYIKYQDKPLINLYKERGLINYLPQHHFHPKSVHLNRLLKIYGIDPDLFFNYYTFLWAYRSKPFSQLSGGEKRLVELSLILEAETKFSILDEPFSHIMPKYISFIKERIIEASSKKGILITDHLYENVLDISDHLYLMREGILKLIKDQDDLRVYGYIR
jgi:ABC-type multidrug transport system ATPase subunit